MLGNRILACSGGRTILNCFQLMNISKHYPGVFSSISKCTLEVIEYWIVFNDHLVPLDMHESDYF